jgi:hypothetical protein
MSRVTLFFPAGDHILEQPARRFLNQWTAPAFVFAQTAGADQRIDQAEFIDLDAKQSQAAPAASAATVLAKGCGTARCHAGF